MAQERGRTLDMTSGRILPLLLQFAIPVMLGHLFQNFYNLADMTIAGHAIGDQAIAAISASQALVMLINNVSLGFNSGNTILVSNAFGAGDRVQCRRNFAGAIQLCVALSLLGTILLLATIDPLLRLINTPAALFAEAKNYIVILICGLITTMAYNMLACVFRAVGNSRVPLLFLILSSLLNVGLDVLLMVVFSLGVTGAALATVFSQFISVMLSALYLYRNYPWLRVRKEDLLHNRKLLFEMLPMGISIAFANSLYAIGDIAITGAVNALGTDAMIARAAGTKIRNFCVTPSIGMANTCASFAAQNYGAGKLERITKGVHTSVLFNVICNVFTYTIVFFLGAPLLRFVTNTESAGVIANGQLLLRLICAFIFAQSAVMTYRMSLSSMKRKILPIIGTAIELVLRCFSAWVLAPRLGFLGICLAEPLSWVISGAVMAISYYAVMHSIRRRAPKPAI